MAKIKASHKKFTDEHPDMIAVRKYEQEIEALQEKYDAANDTKDWTMRHFYGNQIQAKRTNLAILKEKMSKRFAYL